MEEVEEEEEEESPPPAPQALRLRLKRRHISWTSQRVLTSVAMGYAEMTLGMRGASRRTNRNVKRIQVNSW